MARRYEGNCRCGCRECRNEISRLKHTVSRRGTTISSMYYALQQTLDSVFTHHPENFVEVPLGMQRAAPQRRAEQADMARRIEALLRQARELTSPAEPFDIPANFSCNVCFERYDTGEHLPLTLMCGHTLCLSCMSRLPAMICPSCREPINAFTRLYV